MEDNIHYDPYEHLFSPSSVQAHQLLYESNSPKIFDSSNVDSQYSSDPSLNSNDSSSLQSIPYSPDLSVGSTGLNINENEIIDVSLLEQLEKLRILAQPRAFYRERYCSETDPSKHRAQRFIRADDDTSKYEYPTVEIPFKWRDSTRDLYIRVTLVTVFSEKVPVVCIHPYAIDTQENGVLRDPYHNSLYFPITREESVSSQKSFRISRKKMIQHDLRSYGPLRLFDLDGHDIQRVTSSHDAKQIIEIYQLWKSELVFTIAELLHSNSLPTPIHFTSVTSQVMCDDASGRRKSLINDTLCTTVYEDDMIICVPRKGDWSGGDDVLITIPKLDRRKGFNLYFDYGLMGVLGNIKASFVDTKTIFLQTPPCAIAEIKQNFVVPIVVTQNDSILARIKFVYLAPATTTRNICPGCQFNMINNNHIGNKRRHLLLEPTESDGGDALIQQMSRLTTEEKPPDSNHKSTNDDKSSKFDKYLTQLQEAVVDFVRTNNPSRLFRRTRLLIAKCEENPPPLDDAIRRDHTNLALKLIEQSLDMPYGPNGLLEQENNDGETPLLLSAKLNQWILMEAILKKRLDLIEKTDKSDNNILHHLANLSDGEANQTIKNVLALIPDHLRIKLLQKKNQDNQTPIDIAQTKNHSHCFRSSESI